MGRISHGGSQTSEDFDQQLSESRWRSISLLEETLYNNFDLAHKIVHAKSPGDLLQLESEFLSRQAQMIAERSSEIDHNAGRGAQGLTSQTVRETSRKASQAA